MKKKIILCIMFLIAIAANAQQQTELRGNVINSVTKEPVSGVRVTLIGQGQTETTDVKGEFHFIRVMSGDDMLSFSSNTISPIEIPVRMEADGVTLIKDVQLIVYNTSGNSALVGILDEAVVDDDTDGSSQGISSMIIFSNDIYLSKAGYQLSTFRFKVRGYDNIYQEKYINGVKFNDQNRGLFNYASIGALNDLTRNGDAVNYMDPNTFTFGAVGGSENLDMRAGSYAKGGKLTMTYTNRNYYLRGMASYSSGLMDDGYAFTAALGGRYADEGNVDGTFYRNMSYAFAMEKQWNEGKHSISFTTFGSPVERGQQGSSVQEVYNLVDDNLYNPNWGYQNGKKRNSRIVDAFDPTVIASHIWKINRSTTLTTGVGTHYAKYGGTALNWYNAQDPRPDYYRYLPSYGGNDKEYIKKWGNDKSISQINWYKMYEVNKTAKEGRDDPNSALYMVENRHSDLFEVSLNSTLNTVLKNNSKLTVGLGLRKSKSKQYKTVEDLLGSQYVIDIDKFAERDFHNDQEMIQNDLNNSNRKAYKGDKFGYNFKIDINSADLWFQNQYSTRVIDYYYGGKVSYTEFQREGRMKNGRYRDNSYGKGKSHNFIDFGFKTGLTYKISGRQFITGNVSFSTDAPLPNNAYISSRITDKTVDLESSKTISADISYIFSMPSFTGRVSVFQTNFFDQMKKSSFYNDYQKTFVHHILTGVDKVNRGVELGGKYRLNTNWSFDLVGTVAEYFYSNNPGGIISYENGSANDLAEKTYIKDYYVGSTPQIAGTLGINYFYDYWFLSLNVNGFARNYVDIAPIRRLASNYSTVNPSNTVDYAGYKALIDQERFGSGYTLDFTIGKILYLPNRQSVNFNLAFNNILNRENVRTGGFEQGRSELSNPNKFANKYFYMQGFNCFLNTSYRF